MRATVIVAAIIGAGCGEAIEQTPTTAEPIVEPLCGNGLIDEGEICDDGDDDDSDHCLSNCQLASCGDGITQFPEHCDDANDNDNDACLSTCRLNVCGDGFLHDGVEECDDAGETAGCDWECSLPSCGDGWTNPAAGEECDDGVQNSDWYPNRCRANCVSAHCGDGVIDWDEECDSGANNSDDQAGACRTNCRKASCGDGVVDYAEVCDSVEGCSASCTPSWLATEVTTRGLHACALRVNGLPVCWGDDSYGQASPPEVELVTITAGERHTCGLTLEGVAVCWGAGHRKTHDTCYHECYGDLCFRSECGQAAPPARVLFVDLIAGPYHTCGIGTDRKVTCWGDSFHGATDAPDETFTALSAGGYETCGINEAGAIRCWGLDYPEIPTSANGPFVDLSLGWGSACAIDAAGAVTCWGVNDALAPTPALALADTTYWSEACALDNQSHLRCWSQNGEAAFEAGLGDVTLSQASTGYFGGCGLTLDSHVICWDGHNSTIAAVPLLP